MKRTVKNLIVGISKGFLVGLFVIPLYLASAADLYVSSGRSVYKITPDGSVSVFSTGFNNAQGLAFDSAGNLYVAETGARQVSKVTHDGTKSIFSGGMTSAPVGLAFDATDNLYASSGGTIYKIAPNQTRTVYYSKLNFVTGLALDGLGNLFAADYNLHIIAKITPARVASQFATTLGQPNGLAFDSAGNLYLANEGSGQINKYTPAGAGSIFASGQGSPNGLAFDGSLLYEGDFQNGAINKIAPDSSVLPFVTMSSGNASWIAFVPTPEPGSMVLLAIGGVWVFFQRRRLSNVSNSPTVAHKS